MQINISTKHLENPSRLKEYAAEKAEKLGRFSSRIDKILIVLDRQKDQTSAEMILTPSRGPVIVGKTSDTESHAAIDHLIQTMERRLTKLAGKGQDHRRGLPAAEQNNPSTGDARETA